MTLHATYYSPTVGSTPGWSVDLDPDTIRLASLSVVQAAEQGEAGISSVTLDDPLATVGHDGDAVLGLKQMALTETACPVGRRRVFTGYTGDRTYRRGAADSLRVGAARAIEVTVVDVNAFLGFRVFRETDANRPAETDVERVQWLLAHSFLSGTLVDNGRVDTGDPVDLDEHDYRGAKPVDILNDCAQQSGKNYYVYYDEVPGEFALSYDFVRDNGTTVDFRVSNVEADVDDDPTDPASTTFAPTLDASLDRDPSRVVSGVYMPYSGGAVFRELEITADTFGRRDTVQTATDLKTAAKAEARADRITAENATEDDRLTIPIRLPAAHVNDWYPGEAAQVKLTHLPGYEDWVFVRSLRRTVAQDVENPEWYLVTHEATPVQGSPTGAAHYQKEGIAYSGIPELPEPTVPGTILLAVLLSSGNTTKFPTQFRAKDGPNVSPAPPEVLPFPDADGWTVIGTSTTDHSGQNIGGPCGMAYGGPWLGNAGVCTSGQLIAAAWRYVQPGEITTKPTQFSTELLNSSALTFLWNLPTTVPPSGVFYRNDGNNADAPGACVQSLPSISGNALAIFLYPLSSGHGSVINPAGASNAIGEPDAIKIRGDAFRTWAVNYGESNWGSDEGALADDNADGWAQMQQLPSGGVASASITPHAAYSSLNWCGLVIALPPGIELPDIPWPGNQTT